MTLSTLLGTELPLIQAPMAGVQDSALAIAVCGAGGLGSLPSALMTPQMLRDEVAALRAATARPFNLNFFCHPPPVADDAAEAAWRAVLARYHREFGIDPATIAPGPVRRPFDDDALALLEAVRPHVVSFHFGLPAPALVERVRALGCTVMSSATTVAEARWLESHGADVVIAQGLEAGGHRGIFLDLDLTTQVGTMALLPQVVRALRCPVVAAGGIADACGVAAAMALGAAGVQVGTAFLLCPEATTGALHRRALHSPEALHTALTNLYTGRPARGMLTRLMRELGPMNALAPAFPLAGAALAPLRTSAEALGRTDFSPLWAGQNTRGCRDAPAAEIVRELAHGLPAG